MMEEQKTPSDLDDKQGQRNWVAIGLWLTLAWLVVLAAGTAAGHYFDYLTIGPLELNELGDFLAGITAPLAFLWLFVATMVQSQELQAQRQELKLTRREFAMSRQVAKEARDEVRAQVEVAKETARFMEAQTKAAEQQAQIAQDERAEKEFSGLLDDLVTYFRQQGRLAMRSVSDAGRWEKGPERSEVYQRTTKEENVVDVLDRAMTAVINIRGKCTDGMVVGFVPDAIRNVDDVVAKTNDIMSMTATGPAILSKNVKSLGIDKLHDVYGQIRDHAKKLELDRAGQH